MELRSSNTGAWKRVVSVAERWRPGTLLTLWTRRVAPWIVFASLAPFNLAAQNPAPSLKVSPQTISMGAFYNGARVRIEGTAPAGSQVLVVIRGDERDESFNKKGRVGPIWVNTDTIHVAQVPSVFLSFWSGDVNSVLDRASIEAYQLDESAIKNRMRCRSHYKCTTTKPHGSSGTRVVCTSTEPDPSYRELIRSSFLALKSREGTYQTHPNTVKITDSTEVDTRYSLDLEWPRKAPPGSYQVAVFACRNRSVIAQSSTPLQVVEVGFPAQIATLAAVHPWRYGGTAVLVAVLAGFTIDALTVRLRRRSWRKARPKPRGGPPLPRREPDNPVEAVSDVHEPVQRS